MATLASLVIKLQLDSSDYQKNLQSASQKLGSWGKSMTSAGKSLSLGLTTPLVAAGGAALKLAIDAEETASKFNTVLGPAAAEVNQRITELQRTIPATRQELQNSIADFSALSQATGLSAAAATKLADGFTVAAADLGSFNNVPTAQAIQAIRSALVGSSEPLLAFGIDTRQAALEAKALEMGLISEGQAMDAATRQTVLLAQIHADAAHAMGDAARTAGSTSNQLKFLKADVIDLATQIGTQLIPIVTPLITKLGEWVQKFTELSPTTQKVILVVAGLAAALGPVLLIVGTMATGLAALLPALGLLISPIGLVVAAVVALGVALVLAYKHSETFRNVVNGVWDSVKVAAETAWAGMKVAIDALGRAWTWLKDTAIAAFTAVRDFIGPIVQEIRDTIQVRFIDPIMALWQVFGDDLLRGVKATWDSISLALGVAWRAIAALAQASWDTIKNVIQTMWGVIDAVVSGALAILKNTILFGLNLIQGDWQAAWDNIVGILTAIKETLVGVADAIWEGIKAEFATEIEAAKAQVQGLSDGLAGIFTTMKDILEGLARQLWAGLTAIYDSNVAAVKRVVDTFKGDITGIFTALKTRAIEIVTELWDGIKNVFTGAIGDVKRKVTAFKDDIERTFRQLKDVVVGNSIWVEMWNLIKSTTDISTAGIESSIGGWVGRIEGKFKGLFGNLLNEARGWLGTLDGLLGTDLGALFDGLLGRAGSWVSGMAGQLLGATGLGGVFNTVAGLISGPWGAAIMGALNVLGIDVSGALGAIASGAQAAVQGVAQGVAAAGRAVASAVGSIASGVGSAVGAVGSAIGSALGIGGMSEAQKIAAAAPGTSTYAAAQLYEQQFGGTARSFADLGRINVAPTDTVTALSSTLANAQAAGLIATPGQSTLTQQQLRGGSTVYRSPAAVNVTVAPQPIYLDGKKIATVAAPHIAKMVAIP